MSMRLFEHSENHSGRKFFLLYLARALRLDQKSNQRDTPY